MFFLCGNFCTCALMSRQLASGMHDISHQNAVLLTVPGSGLFVTIPGCRMERVCPPLSRRAPIQNGMDIISRAYAHPFGYQASLLLAGKRACTPLRVMAFLVLPLAVPPGLRSMR